MSEQVRRRVVVRGYVQGVFFRDTCRREANARGVGGWVANRSDGAVEAVFEGEPDMVDAMIWFVRDGPGSSDVARIEVDEEEPASLRGFKVA